MLSKHTLKNDSVVVIRKPQESDAAGIIDLLRTVASECNFMVLTLPEIERDLSIEKEIEWIKKYNDPGNLLLIAEHESKIVGIANITSSTRQRQNHLGTLAISISSAFCNAGLGSEMMKILLEWAKQESGLHKVALAVFANNERAIHIYKKFGFAEEGRRIKEINLEEGVYLDDILMYYWVK